MAKIWDRRCASAGCRAIRTIEISRRSCAGLAAAHDRDVLHRDLEPDSRAKKGRVRKDLEKRKPRARRLQTSDRRSSYPQPPRTPAKPSSFASDTCSAPENSAEKYYTPAHTC